MENIKVSIKILSSNIMKEEITFEAKNTLLNDLKNQEYWDSNDNSCKLEMTQDLKDIVYRIHSIQNLLENNKVYINLEKMLYDALDKIIVKNNSNQFFQNKMTKLFDSMAKKNEDDLSNERYYALGSVLGAFLGDALGSYYEFQFGNKNLFDDKVVFKKENPVWGTGPGQLTDDSEMALCLGLGLMDSISKTPNFNKVAYYYGYWYLGGPFDIGNTTHNAMKIVKNKKIFQGEIDNSKHEDINLGNYHYIKGIFFKNFIENSKKKNSQSCSNGFLMRKTPLAIFCMLYVKACKNEHLTDDHVTDMKSFENACIDDTKLTHPHSNTHTASVIYSLIITRIIYLRTYFPDCINVGENTLNYIKNYINANHHNNLSSDLKEILSLIENRKPIKIAFNENQFFESMCWYLYGLLYAIKALQEIENSNANYYDIIKDVINLGGDTDTNAAIVGGVIGAYYGPENLEKTQLEILIKFNPTICKTNHTRPSIFSPGFIMFVVKRIFDIRSMNEEKINDYIEMEKKDNLPIAICTLLKYFTEEKN